MVLGIHESCIKSGWLSVSKFTAYHTVYYKYGSGSYNMIKVDPTETYIPRSVRHSALPAYPTLNEKVLLGYKYYKAS